MGNMSDKELDLFLYKATYWFKVLLIIPIFDFSFDNTPIHFISINNHICHFHSLPHMPLRSLKTCNETTHIHVF